MTRQLRSIFVILLTAAVFTLWVGKIPHLEAASLSRQSSNLTMKKLSQKQPKTMVPKRVTVATQVKSVTPSKLKLVLGAKGKKVTVKGLALSSITGVKLLQNNRSARGVSASLQGSAKADSVKVSLSVASNAKPGSYQLQLLAGNKTINISSSTFTAEVIAPKKKIHAMTGNQLGLGGHSTQSSVRSGQSFKASSKSTLVHVKSANPDKINLITGAASNSVTLKGTNLNRVIGVQVVSNNSPSSNIKAIRLKGSSDESCKIKLNALKNAAMGNYGLRLLINGGAPITLSSHLFLLHVSEPVFMGGNVKEKGSISLLEMQANQKRGMAGLKVVGQKNKGQGGGNPLPTTMDELKKASSKMTSKQQILGEKLELGHIDGENLSQQGIKTLLPDIAIVDLEQEQNVLKARLKVFNNQAGEQLTLNLKFDIYISDQLDGSSEPGPITFIGADPVWVDLAAYSFYSGWERIKVHVNPDKAVIESNYDNNIKSEAISFEGNTIPGYPDFYVDKVYVGSDKKVRVRIGNVGRDYSGPLKMSVARVNSSYKKTQDLNVSINKNSYHDAIIDLASLSNSRHGEAIYKFTVTVNPEGGGQVPEYYLNNNSGQGSVDAKLLFNLQDLSLVQVDYVEQGITLGETQLISVELYKPYTLRLTIKNMGDGLPTSDVLFRRTCNGRTSALANYPPNYFQTQDYIGTGQNSYRSKGTPYNPGTLGTYIPCVITIEHMGESIPIFHYSERAYN